MAATISDDKGNRKGMIESRDAGMEARRWQGRQTDGWSSSLRVRELGYFMILRIE